MELINVTPLVADYTTATDKQGQEWMVLVAKGTYGFPARPELEPMLLPEQQPLVSTDEFEGDPACTAPTKELDFALRKPRCDVLLTGSAYAPEGRLAHKVTVSLRVGSMNKSLNVLGDRVWERGAIFGVVPGDPRPFRAQRISYGTAYGGIDRSDPKSEHWYPRNPAGVGARPHTANGALYGQPVPNTEELNVPVKSPTGKYAPMAFGPLGRSWQERIRWAGTYDQAWRDEKYPFLPEDFDERYFQSAPGDQQIDYIQGGEQVSLTNLTPGLHVAFKLPMLSEPFTVHYKNGESKRIRGVVDTLVLEPDFARFSLVLRASFALGRSVHELRCVELGRVMPQAVSDEPAPREAKPHYKGLSKLIAAQRVARGTKGEYE